MSTMEELSHVATRISQASQVLQDRMHLASTMAEKSGQGHRIPNIIVLVERLERLEQSIVQIQQQSADLARRRHAVGVTTARKTLENQTSMETLMRANSNLMKENDLFTDRESSGSVSLLKATQALTQKLEAQVDTFLAR